MDYQCLIRLCRDTTCRSYFIKKYKYFFEIISNNPKISRLCQSICQDYGHPDKTDSEFKTQITVPQTVTL